MTFALNVITTTVTVDVPDCPPAVAPLWHGLSSGGVDGLLFAGFAVIALTIVAIWVVRYNAWKEKTAQHTIRGNTAVKLAEHHRTCDTCGTVYAPEETAPK